MSTAGEAADLFGAPDASLDPFSAALGGDTRHDEPHGATEASNAVSDLFGPAADEFPVGGTDLGVAQTDAQQTWYDSSGQQSYAYDNTASTAYAPAYPDQASYSQPNGAYTQQSQYGQSNAYNQWTAPTASAYESSYGQQSGYAPQQTYAPYTQRASAYTPPTNSSAYIPAMGTTASTYAPGGTAQTAPVVQSGSYSTSTYDPYKPAQTRSSYEPAPQGTTVSTPATHDPYQRNSYAAAPAAPTVQETYPYGTASHTSSYAPSTVSVPAPPAPISSAPPAPSPTASVTQYRPKTANAFDPPIPPPKTRHASGPPRQASFSSQSPVSPPPRTALTPQSMPPPRKTPDLHRHSAPPPRTTPDPHVHSAPPPRRTPDPHAHSVPPSRDSHSGLHAAPPQPTPPAPHAPTVNGYASHSGYQPSYSPRAAHVASGPYNEVAQAGVYPQEGLPKVNDTYAPHAAYSPTHPEAASPYTPPVSAHEVSGLNGFDARVGSPVRETIPEVDEEEVQAAPHEPPALTAVTSSPQTVPVDLHPHGEHVWPAQPSHQPSLGFSSERAKSPPRSRPPSAIPASATTQDPYAPPPRSNASDRAKSPGASSVHSIQKHPYEAPRRDSVTKSSPVSRPLSSQSRRSTFSSQYDPQSAYDPKRATSPTGSVRSFTAAKQNAYDPYAPTEKQAAHGRQASNGSVYSTTSVADPYAPSRQPARQSSEHVYGSFTLPTQPSSFTASGSHPATAYDRTGGQVVTLASQTHSTYAPSPSLLGTNDPLGRTSARVPVISFGFGGKLVTCFHGANMNTGFDVALSSRQSTDIKIQLIHKVIPESILDTSADSYPGPLYSDPGSPTASIVRTGAQALKAKKARVIKYLEERAEEINGGLGYHRVGSVEQSRAEAKRILVLLLKAMVENDGRLSGNAQVDAAIRAALVPQQGVSSSPEASLSTGLIPATSTEHLSNYSSLNSTLPNLGDQVVSQSLVRGSQLDKISELLALGDRRGACHYAADEKLWAHALLIASSVDKECWKDVVTEWIRAELVHDPAQPQDGKSGREPLRFAYSLFGGNGATAVQELVHPSSLLQHGQNALQIPQPQLSFTPMSPNFPATQPLNISQEVLATWAQTASMILSNPLTPESSQALTALGDQLAAHQWAEAAHACYLLSPQTSPIGGMGGTSRFMLLGSPHSPTFYKDSDSIVFSEILEFAMSLAILPKGQEPFVGLPHLQPYRLIRAASLAETGHVQLANRYCEAITSCINRGAPVLNITFVQQLKNLSDRLTAAPQLDKSGSWIGGKVAKPSLDSIGNWLEGRFTKFIAGEDNSPRPEDSKGMERQQQSFSGPFANYSSISSATTSAYPSPHQSVTDLTEMLPVPAPPFRTGSAMAVHRPPSRSHLQINRASSAMDHVRPFQQQRGGPPIARVASANAAAFADAASNGQARGPYGYGNGYAPAAAFDQSKDSNSHGDVSSMGNSKPQRSGSWWGASESDVSTPTASSFGHVDEQPSSSASNSGFISLMDDPILSMTPTATKAPGSPMPHAARNDFEDDDDDDLGLGNSSRKKVQASENGDVAVGDGRQEEKPKAAEPEKPAEAKPAASSGWLSRLWKRNDSSSPGPVKANLGEQSSFYFDKELGKWVNKTAGAPESKPTAPPPPRAQTASPSRSMGGGPPPASPLAGGPPPTRPATAGAIDLTSEPPRRPPTRVRSNLVPSDATDQTSAPPSPMPPSGTPPPGNGPPRARSAASKRNVRSRYVDVFSQEGSS